MADFTDEDDALLAELGVEVEAKATSGRTAREERIIAGFEEIQRFVDEHGRAPQHGEDKDIFEVLNFSEDSAETVMIRRQSHDRVRDMLQSLPEDQREVIILRHYADMSFKEIAAATNCSINTALGRMRYGLINLRKLMTQKQIAL